MKNKKKNHFKSKALLFCSHLVTSLHINVEIHPWCRSRRSPVRGCGEDPGASGTAEPSPPSLCGFSWLPTGPEPLPSPVSAAGVPADRRQAPAAGPVLQHQGHTDVF